MSTEKRNSGHGDPNAPFHETVTFEPRDINVGTVAKQLIYLGLTIVIALLICIPVLKFLTGMAAENDTPMPPVRAQMSTGDRDNMSLPPEPRLQGVPGHTADAQQDLRDKIAADTTANESLGWVDKANGIAKIPVSEAMKIIAEIGGTAAPNAAASKGSTGAKPTAIQGAKKP
jgi:hypothetical protein